MYHDKTISAKGWLDTELNDLHSVIIVGSQSRQTAIPTAGAGTVSIARSHVVLAASFVVRLPPR